MKKFIILSIILIVSCDTAKKEVTKNRINIPATEWRFTFDLNGHILPFNGSFSNVEDYSATLTLKNGEERIVIEDVLLQNDSVIAQLPFFNTQLKLQIDSPYMLSGVWVNNDQDNYKIPVTAEQGQTFRFTSSASNRELPSKYLARFEIGTADEYPAVLLLSNSSGELTGTFLTETGDYRYLEGNIMNGAIYLSTFDGSHAFYFQAEIKGDSLVNGIFKSGLHYQTSWAAVSDSLAGLKSPETLTTLNKNEIIDFSLLDQKGDLVTWENLDLDEKVVVLDIMGTWCPNCMDASRALKELSLPYSDDDLVIVPVLFEYSEDLNQAKQAFSKYADQLDIPNKFLFGGKASKKIASSKFPMLDSITSFPTLIFIGKDRKVAEVYTGFYGPGTGEYYTQFMDSKRKLLRELVDQS